MCDLECGRRATIKRDATRGGSSYIFIFFYFCNYSRLVCAVAHTFFFWHLSSSFFFLCTFSSTVAAASAGIGEVLFFLLIWPVFSSCVFDSHFFFVSSYRCSLFLFLCNRSRLLDRFKPLFPLSHLRGELGWVLEVAKRSCTFLHLRFSFFLSWTAVSPFSFAVLFACKLYALLPSSFSTS